MLISSCAGDPLLKQLKADAKRQAAVNVGVNLPPYPEDCRQTEPHAKLTVGGSKTGAIVKERAATDRANERTVRCGPLWYDGIVKNYSGGGAGSKQ